MAGNSNWVPFVFHIFQVLSSCGKKQCVQQKHGTEYKYLLRKTESIIESTMRILFLLATVALGWAQYNPNTRPGRTSIVHLFEWSWTDIALECERYLAPNGFGGVQISPPSENVIITNPWRPWWERYQPVSYKLCTRSGNEDEFIDMVTRCNNVSVHIYVDAVINHMCASGLGSENNATCGSYFNAKTRDFPAVPYSGWDFNDDKCKTGSGGIDNYGDLEQVRDCRLVSLLDLALEKDYVRSKIAEYMNYLIDIGVAGFRIDAAKHMWPGDMKATLDKLKDLNTDWFSPGSRPFIYQEVIDLGGESIKSSEYFGNGRDKSTIMAGIEDRESLKQENFTWLLRVSELEEDIARLQWELEIAQSQKKQAEAKATGLEQRVEAGRKEGGPKEIRRLIAAEAERTRALEWLMAEETKRSRRREEKLQEMQREMAAWRARYEALCKRNLFLEKELETGVRENEELQSQLKSVEVEKGHLEEQVRSLETHLEASSARQAVTNAERKQSQLQRLTLRQQIRALEAENKTLRIASSQTATKGQDSGELEGPQVTSTATQMEGGPKAPAEDFLEAVQEDLEDWQERCLQAEYQVEELREKLIESYAQAEKTGRAITKEIEKVREYMTNHEALEEQKQSLETEVLKNQGLPRTKGLEIPKEEGETEQQEKSTRMEALSGINPTRMREEITSTVMECLDRRWGQWVNQYTDAMNCLREKLEKFASWYVS
ncbi:pancreatic alpha-amylase-like [Alligator mississippiensis]|uniref:Alpha-amylase n=1 Tax=Alligator mississippiensis TaxID=8496 RepID=A0A151MGB8_ALLMI|nr:pancreatic alpha-amylase-like [Alligator mississippiensis]